MPEQKLQQSDQEPGQFLPESSEYPDNIGALLELKDAGKIAAIELVVYKDKELPADLVVTRLDGTQVIVVPPPKES